MERDIMIMNKIMRTAYDLRSSVWFTAHVIRIHIDESLSISEIKQYLALLCDREMLKKNSGKGDNFARKCLTGKKKTERFTHKSDLYRITDQGIRTVQSSIYQKGSRTNAYVKLVARG